MHLRVAGELWPPWFEMTNTTDGNGGWEQKFQGIMWNILGHLSAKMDFEYTLIRPSDGKWGSMDESGGWNGMIGMLRRNEVDLALGPFGMSPERAQACDFSIPIFIDHLIPVTPVMLSRDPYVLARPFQMEVWFVLLASCALFLALFMLVEPLYLGNASSSEILIFGIKSIFSEGSVQILRRDIQSNLICIFWLLGMQVLVYCYSGTLTALLTVPKAPFLVESMEDMVEQERFPWSIESGSLLEQMGQLADPNTVFGHYVKGAEVLAGTCYDNIGAIKAGDVASICERVSVQKMISDDFASTASCNLYSGSDEFMSVAFAMAFPVGSPFLDQVNPVLLALVESGLIKKSLNQLMPNGTQCSTISEVIASHGQTDTKALAIQDLWTSFQCLMMGFALGSMVLAFEIGLQKWRKDRAVLEIPP